MTDTQTQKPSLERLASFLYVSAAANENVLQQNPHYALRALERAGEIDPYCEPWIRAGVKSIQRDLHDGGLQQKTVEMLADYDAVFSGLLEQVTVGDVRNLCKFVDGSEIPEFDQVINYNTSYADLAKQVKEVEYKKDLAKIESKRKGTKVDPQLTDEDKKVLDQWTAVQTVLGYAKAYTLFENAKADRDTTLISLQEKYKPKPSTH